MYVLELTERLCFETTDVYNCTRTDTNQAPGRNFCLRLSNVAIALAPCNCGIDVETFKIRKAGPKPLK